jgi:PAS domain-containing protein
MLSEKNSRLKHMDRREWWLWSLVVVITMLLTGGIASFALPLLHGTDSFYGFQIRQSAWGLLGLVLLFDIYSLYQQFQIQSVRRQLIARDELFRVISENAADMIAVVDQKANRIYNSPAYERVLGYSAQELQRTPAMDQVHPDDRARVALAAEQARKRGQGERIDY